MASCSSFGVSSIYQANPSLDVSRKPIAPPPSFLRSPAANNPFRLFSPTPFRSNSSISFVPSAVATPNSSVLSEEAFKGLGFAKGGLDVSDSEYEEDFGGEGEEVAAVDKDELALSKLGLPQRLVDTLEKRGITSLFPIQVWVMLFVFWFVCRLL